MSKLSDFFAVVCSHANAKGIVSIEDLVPLFSGKSKSYISTNFSLLKSKGLVEKASPGKWKILNSFFNFSVPGRTKKRDEPEKQTGGEQQSRILMLTPEEKEIFDLLIEVQTKCPDKSNGPRFTQGGLNEVLNKQGISELEWRGLEKKLLGLHVISKESGIGKKGQIFDLDQELLLRYLTDENLIKVTLWREEQVRDRLKAKISNLKDRAGQIAGIEEEIQNSLVKLEQAKMEVEELEDKISALGRKLQAEFSDRDKVVALQDLLKGIEYLGEDATINFLKDLLGE